MGIFGSRIRLELSAHTDYQVNIPELVKEKEAELKEVCERSLADIASTNRILAPLKRLTSNEKRRIVKECQKIMRSSSNLLTEYVREIREKVQECLKIDIDYLNSSKNLADLFFYYIIGDCMDGSVKLDVNALYIVFAMCEPVNSNKNVLKPWPIMRKMLAYDQEIFSQFYFRLGENPINLLLFLYKHPQLLFSEFNYSFIIHEFIHYLSPHDIQQLLISVTDNLGRTCVFYSQWSQPFCMLYKNEITALYKFLRWKDNRGFTALQANMKIVTEILMETYIPRYRAELLGLIEMIDGNSETAVIEMENRSLNWLFEQAEDNRYVFPSDPQVLLIYNTLDRGGAKTEADSIHAAFKNLYGEWNVQLQSDKTGDETIKLIKQTAKETNSALIVVLMSHGNVGIIDDSEGKSVSLTSIEAAMCDNKDLNTRPKVLILQSCQTRDALTQNYNSLVHDVSPRGAQRFPFSPISREFCSIMSTVQGEPAERNKFIPYLADEIDKQEINVPIEKLVKRVQQRFTAENLEQKVLIQGTMSADFCFANKRPHEDNSML